MVEDDGANPRWDWERVERLLSDMKADGYEAVHLQTSASSTTAEKDVVIHVERESDD